MNKCLESLSNKGDPQLRIAVGEIIHRIGSALPDLKEPVRMYLAGGMAVNFYTGYRPTVDIDASFSHRLLLPKAENLFDANLYKSHAERIKKPHPLGSTWLHA